MGPVTDRGPSTTPVPSRPLPECPEGSDRDRTVSVGGPGRSAVTRWVLRVTTVTEQYTVIATRSQPS